MSHVTGLMMIDAPASALNNAGADTEARTDNATAVKFIRAPNGRYPYVSAQSLRYWIRNTLNKMEGWTPSPVFFERKIAYTDAEPSLYAEDDLFGYMRAPSNAEKKSDSNKPQHANSTPIDKDTGEVTRISPFRVGTLVSVAPASIVSDFGTMVRAERDPIPYEHQFYRAHLLAPLSIHLSCAGTFFISKRVGYKNIDSHRQASAEKAGATPIELYGTPALRLPDEIRQARTSLLVRALGRLEGGAKQTLHLTDTTPAVLVLAVCKGGGHPFMRLFARGEANQTVLRTDVLEESLRVYAGDLQSDLFFGWAKGFLDAERDKLISFAEDSAACHGKKIIIAHPREAADMFASQLTQPQNREWFA